MEHVMTPTVRARYEHGRLTPLEPLDLDEGAEVTVSVEDAAEPRGAAAVLKLIERLHADIPDPDPNGPMHDLARTYRLDRAERDRARTGDQ